MADFTFGGALFRTESHRNATILNTWITAGGRNSEEEVRSILARNTDTALVNELVGAWFTVRDGFALIAPASGTREAEEVAVADLINAMVTYRQDFTDGLFSCTY